MKRSALEKDYKQIDMVMNLNKIRELSAKEGYDENELLGQLKSRGITGIAVQEDTITTLSTQGKITFFSTNDLTRLNYFYHLELPGADNVVNGELMVACQDFDLFQRMKTNLQSYLGDNLVKTGLINEKYHLLFFQGDREELEKVGLGFSKEDIFRIQEMGFNLILRPKNTPKINLEIFRTKILQIDDFTDIAVIIFDEEEVLGYPSAKILAEMATYLKEKKYSFGIVEFASQKGINRIASTVSELAVRVHSITKEEMEKIDKNKAIERWIRAAQERNIRLFYLNPFLNVREGNLIESNLDYIKEIKDELIQNKYQIGKAALFSPYQNSLVIIALIGLGVISAGMLLLLKFFNISKKYEIVLFVAICLFLFIINIITGKIFLMKILALASALVFPTLAIILNKKYFIKTPIIKNGHTPSTNKPFFLYSEIIRNVFTGITRTMLISLSGGLIIAALLTQYQFILAIQLFSGIKIAYVLPILLVTWYLWWVNSEDKKILLDEVKKPILFEHALLMSILLVFGVVYITRSGNFSFLAISNMEEKIRIFLEKYLIARPRNKEFLIGYPLLSLAIAMNYLDIQYLKLPIIIIGCVAPITVVNTFCHIHSPILFSLLRTFNGYWLGLLFSILLTSILFFLLKFIRTYLNDKRD
jgi:hypothetical protein